MEEEAKQLTGDYSDPVPFICYQHNPSQVEMLLYVAIN